MLSRGFSPIEESYIKSLCPHRPEDGHKGSFGSVLLWAGSMAYSGAAHLCASGALRSGVGLVHVLCPAPLTLFLTAKAPPLIVHPLPEGKDISLLQRFWHEKAALVLGPGIPPDDEFFKIGLFPSLESAMNILLDAGALSFVAEHLIEFEDALLQRKENALLPPILTPHPGEFLRLFPESDPNNREKDALTFAQKYHCVTVLKGKRTVIASPDGRVLVNTTGNNGLSKGGSGDVLSGMMGSFLAQGLAPFEAACCGVYFHGLAGDLAAESLGRRYMQPTDLATYLSEAFRICGWEI